MSILTKNDDLRVFKYIISELIIIYDTMTESVPIERVVDVNISNNYFKNIFPVISLKMVMSTDQYLKVVKYKDTVKFKLRVQKYFHKPDEVENKSLYRDYINNTFNVIIEESDIDVDKQVKSQKETNTDETVDTTNDLTEVNNLIEFYLFDKSKVEKTKVTINDIIQNTNMSSIIAYVFQQMDINDLIMSPLDNKRIHKQIVIPPLKGSDVLQYLDYYYGFYRFGTCMYFDFHRTYILNAKGGSTAYDSNEVRKTTIVVVDKNGDFYLNPCSVYRPGQNDINYIIASPDAIDIKDAANIKNIAHGKHLKVVNTTENTATFIPNGTDRNFTENVVTIENNTENSWMAETISYQKKLNDVIITMYLTNIDLDVLEPNKDFTIIFDDSSLTKKYKGVYILESTSISIMEKVNVVAVFRKVPTIEGVVVHKYK